MKAALLFLGLLVTAGLQPVSGATAPLTVDICVYGATPGGLVAAIQASRLGKTSLVLEPTRHLGGLTTGGLGATDIGNKSAIGGIAREFYHRVAQHYAHDSAWTLETRQEYFARKGSSQTMASELASSNATMWTFEPHVASAVFRDLLREAKVNVFLDKRLRRVVKSGAALTELEMEDGTVCRARVFIDASYEGDLLAKAGVSYRIGREANDQFGETLNGIRAETPKHQFAVRVDPFRTPGDPASGLLPFVQGEELGQPGAGDRSVQAYNFRLCFTTNAANRLAVKPPSGYDAAQYELLGRYFQALLAAGKKPKLSEFWNPIWMPNGKTDINNNGGFSTDFIGASYDYPDGNEFQRTAIREAHEQYTRGLLTFLAADPRVPENIRSEMSLWGPCKDEFIETGGWPPQLYIREARRMRSDYVMSERDCRGELRAEDPVGLGAYNMDSHNCRRIVRNGAVENEGDVQVAVQPYPVSFRSIVPKPSECSNLFVPVCLSATHIAYGSIRMEPVFMILGQSAATAAVLAIEDKLAVQNLPYQKLRARLLADGQILEWKR